MPSSSSSRANAAVLAAFSVVWGPTHTWVPMFTKFSAPLDSLATVFSLTASSTIRRPDRRWTPP